MTIGERIREIRKQKKITQADLANRLGIPYQGIGQWERGERLPKKETLLRIIEALDISYSDFLIGTVSVDEIAREIEMHPDKVRAALANSSDIPAEARAHVLHIALALALELSYASKSLDDLYSSSRGFRVASDTDSTISPQLQRMLDAFERLNAQGQQAAADRVEELTEISKYRAYELDD